MSAGPEARAIGLSRLLAPLDLERFLEGYWQRKSFQTEIAASDFETILDRIGPLEIPRVAALATEGCQAWLSNRYVAHSVFPCDASDAAEFHDAGATLYFLNIRVPELTGAIADSLGFRASV